METKKIDLKLLQFQTEIETIKKDGKNEFFKKSNGTPSTYATLPNVLANVKSILNPLKIIVTQPINNNRVFTILTDTESGEFVEASLELPNGLNAQQTGSAITYYRRYTLCSLLALEIDEDDDGNNASNNTNAPASNEKEWLNKFKDKAKTSFTDTYVQVVEALKSKKRTLADVEKKYKLNKELKEELSQL